MHRAALAVEVEAEPVQRQFAEGQVALAAEDKTDDARGARHLPDATHAILRAPAGCSDFHRPECEVVAGSELARCAGDGREDRTAPRSILNPLSGLTCSESTWNSAIDMEGSGRR